MLSKWIELSLEGSVPSAQSGHIHGGSYRFHAPGVLELIPARCHVTAKACVFSVGIHGNETAPIELLGELLARLEATLLTLGAPVLVIIGNLEAIQRSERYLETNLNRLFHRDQHEHGLEPQRARQLMQAVDDFFSRHPDHQRLHYDMHTAIRDSRYPRFAVEPFATTRITPEQWRWLAAADIQAVLHQHQHSWTFSHYSKHYHGAQAFTLELGRVAPFGANDLSVLRPMRTLLEALLEGREPPGGRSGAMRFFRVEHELMRHAQAFTLCFADDTANFTEFAPGTRLACDAVAGDYVVGEQPLAVVFPNAHVELGARAALLVAPSAVPGETTEK